MASWVSGWLDEGPGKSNKGIEGPLVKLDSLESRAPADWHEEKPDNAMRLKQFRLSPIGDDKDHAEIVIFHFGQGQGGSAEQNIKRWKSQFKPPEGKTIQDVSKAREVQGQRSPGDLSGHSGHLFLSSAFQSERQDDDRPKLPDAGGCPQAKKGPYFIRMLGPADTVAHYKKGFDEWIKGFK